MKTKSTASFIGFACAFILLGGCATMEANRTANTQIRSELDDALSLQAQKFATAKPILILGHNAEYPNSVGGVSFTVTFQNTSDKVIKYADFTVTPFNRVGDIATSEIADLSTTSLRATGPFALDYNGSRGIEWGPVWYNSTIAFSLIEKIEIEFMDGTTQIIEAGDLAAIQLRPDNNIFSSGLQQRSKVSVYGSQLRVSRHGRY